MYDGAAYSAFQPIQYSIACSTKSSSSRPSSTEVGAHRSGSSVDESRDVNSPIERLPRSACARARARARARNPARDPARASGISDRASRLSLRPLNPW